MSAGENRLEKPASGEETWRLRNMALIGEGGEAAENKMQPVAENRGQYQAARKPLARLSVWHAALWRKQAKRGWQPSAAIWRWRHAMCINVMWRMWLAI